MEYSKVVYEIARHYLNDRKSTLPEDLHKKLHGAIRARDLQALASASSLINLDVTGLEGYRTLYQLQAFFSKNSVFTDNLVARLSALVSFEDAEADCRVTNNRLDTLCDEGHKFDHLIPKIERCQRYIEEVLGPFPDFLSKLPELIKITSGATVTRSRRKALPFLKVSRRLVCTPGAYPYLSALSQYWGYGEISPGLISVNRVEFVSKSWKTDRTIACEAEGNMFLQLAFDTYAKSRLRRRGINLSDQTLNQRLSHEGSVSGSLATIDLSQASDTLAYNAAALLIPEKWFAYLKAIRSQYGALYPGKRITYEKFSSMGNGSTFALETLVFAAACYAVKPSRFSVYGDDIIIDTEKADELMELLGFLGFRPNTEKSFTAGPFRESCGKFWYEGTDITPFYIREMDGRKAVLSHVANGIMTICQPFGELFDFLIRFIRDNGLRVTPYNGDSMSGVWVHPQVAYSKKLIQTRNWIQKARCYSLTSRSGYRRDGRTLFLWYLSARENDGCIRTTRENFMLLRLRPQNLARGIRISIERSAYSIPSHKFRLKWIHWIPVAGAPENLYWLSEALEPYIAEKRGTVQER